MRNSGGRIETDFIELWADESGATGIKYGLIAARISLAIIGAVNGIGAA